MADQEVEILYRDILDILDELNLKNSKLSYKVKNAYINKDLYLLDDILYDLIWNQDYILNDELNQKIEEAYCQLKESELDDSTKKSYIKELEVSYVTKDIQKIENITNEIYCFNNKDNAALSWYKRQILEFLEWDKEEIQPILKAIRTVEEADIVLGALESSEYITSLKKGYSEAKKIRMRKRLKRRYMLPTYEHALRRNRRIIEKFLQEVNTGINRAKKISKILEYI